MGGLAKLFQTFIYSSIHTCIIHSRFIELPTSSSMDMFIHPLALILTSHATVFTFSVSFAFFIGAEISYCEDVCCGNETSHWNGVAPSRGGPVGAW